MQLNATSKWNNIAQTYVGYLVTKKKIIGAAGNKLIIYTYFFYCVWIIFLIYVHVISLLTL